MEQLLKTHNMNHLTKDAATEWAGDDSALFRVVSK
jgi:hypothetical protein